MNLSKIIIIISLGLFISDNYCQTKQLNSMSDHQAPKLENRQPAVAGQFYPGTKNELQKMLDNLFLKAEKKITDNVIAVICPHAGYVYSGIVAASGFNQVDGSKNYKDIFIIGSSHRVLFNGASIYNKGNFITPLGTVNVDISLADKLIKENSVFNFNTEAHKEEHSLEVELPFLQQIMKTGYKIVPIVIGTQDKEACKEIAKALKPYFNSDNLFIISSDFSHYPSYADAREADMHTAKGIESGSPAKFLQAISDNENKHIPNLSTSACGWTSILTLLEMSESNPDIIITPIKYMNSGDTEYGDKTRVVGYYSIAFLQKADDLSGFNLSDKDKKDLLYMARETIKKYIKEQKTPDFSKNDFSDNLKQESGAFVTLTKNGELRGCIGQFKATKPLYLVVQDMAIASATEDKRFEPVSHDEIDKLELEISVLSPMKEISSIDEIRMGKHGIYIKKDYMSGTFLPQVGKETKWSKEEFLGHCARDKAGIGWDGWKDKDVQIFIYEACVFSE